MGVGAATLNDSRAVEQEVRPASLAGIAVPIGADVSMTNEDPVAAAKENPLMEKSPLSELGNGRLTALAAATKLASLVNTVPALAAPPGARQPRRTQER